MFCGVVVVVLVVDDDDDIVVVVVVVIRFMYKVQYPECGHVMDTYHAETRWMSFMDMDEYPFQVCGTVLR